MNLISKLITATVFSGAMTFSHVLSAQTPYEEFLARSEAQAFNTSVLTLPTADALNTLQTMMGKPASTVSFDINALFSLPDFQIEIPGFEEYFAVKEKIIDNSLGGETWIGDVVYLDPTGYNTGIQGRAYFVENSNGITGTIHAGDNVIQIYPDGAGGQVIVTEDASVFDNEGEILSAVDLGEEEVAASPLVAGRRDGPNVATLSNPYTIDVLWVTTPLAREGGTDTDALIELATTTGNDVLINSEIPAQLRIVGIHDNTTYQESNNMSNTLNDLRNTSDGEMDEVHTIRAELGADMVAIVSGADNYCGIATLNSGFSSSFSANARVCMSGYTPIHEFGHNFGADHDTNQGLNRVYPFGNGLYNNTVEPYWRTVMSYACPGGGCSRIPYFSNSQLTYNDIPLGDPEITDNSRVLRIRVAEVAGFIASAANACTEHSSTNSAHVNAGRAYTQGSWFSRTYYAVGSDESMGSSGYTNTTLAEQPAGYFSVGSCDTSTPSEPQFAPEIQNLIPTPITGGLRIEGEVFDANADAIASVSARESGTNSWTTATLDENNFSVELNAELSGNISVDFRTQDSTGESFEFSTTFDVDVGEAPILELGDPRVQDDSALISGQTIDPDNSVFDIYYQVDGSGNPDSGTWTQYSVNSTYWTVEIDGVSPGLHTFHIYGVDETEQRSNVLSVELEFLPLTAPACVFADAMPSSSRVPGEVDIVGFAEDINNSDIRFDYQVNSGGWVEVGSYTNLQTRNQYFFRLPEVYPEGSALNIEMRAVDSSNLTTHCGTHTLNITYPTEDLAPSCELVGAYQKDGGVQFFMTTSDPNGDQQQMFAKTPDMSEWIQTWPGPISVHQVGITGFGEMIIEGRVVDATGLEGFCETTYTVVDQQITPEVNYAIGRYEVELDTVIASAEIFDNDGDVVSVEFREVGTSSWLAGTLDPTDQWKRRWTSDLGILTSGDYIYEVRATDSGGRVSNTVMFEFSVDRQFAPVIESLTYVVTRLSIEVEGTMSDLDGDADEVWYRLDDNEWQSFNWSSPNFSFTINNLNPGPHTIEVYVQDSWDLRSASEFINIDIDAGQPPSITSVNYEIQNDRVIFDIEAEDADGGTLWLIYSFDGQSQNSTASETYSWSRTWSNPGGGTHTATFTVLDNFNNLSDPVTVEFDIIDQTPCFEDSNSNHESAGRAYIETVGQTCYGTFCFGGTDTYFATGSGDNLGTSASATTSLIESSSGYFELGACSDTTAPVISLSGNNPMDVAQGATYIEPGYTATDNVDGNITANVSVSGTVDTNTIGTYQLTYSVSDSSGNSATNVIRTVNVVADTVIPVITIPGGLTYQVTLNDSFSNPTAQATDNIDGDISANVVVTGSVNTNIVETYYLYYNVSDASGNNADEVIVTVEVLDQPTLQCFTSTLSEHETAGRVYEQYYSYYATGTGTYLGSTFNDANTVVSLEETSPGNWSTTASCN